MALNIRTAAQWLGDQAAAAQTSAGVALDLTVGSVLRAVFEATATVAAWLQSQVLYVAASMRLSTATGTDVDTWLADWGLTRLAPVPASGSVTLSRFTTTGSATILVGWVVQTGDLAQQYAISANPASPFWNATVGTDGGYVIPAGTAGIVVPVLSTAAGSAGNVVAGAINLAGTAMPGIDVITNAAATTGGQDQESDAAFKARFPLFIASLNRATVSAVDAAISDVESGLTYLVSENVDEAGDFTPGHFVVTVDDGTGYPSPTLIAQVYSAVDAVRPVCSTFSVQPPVVASVSIALTLTVAAGYNKPNLIAPVATAITAYVNAQSVGAPLSITRLAAVAYGVSPGIVNVSGVSVNGLTSDFVPASNSVTKTLVVTCS